MFVHDRFGFGFAVLISLFVGVGITLLFKNIFASVVEFKDTYLRLEKGLFQKPIEVDYSQIDKASFIYNKYMELFIHYGNNKLQIPPPSRIAKVKELFYWLSTNNPSIKVEIIRP